MYTSHTLPTGSLLQNSKYKIMKVLGNGGFGITYLAKHNFLEKEVAIKEFYDSNICTRNSDGRLIGLSEEFEKGKENFFSEARTLAKFSNKKNIVQVNDIFKENNTIYFVMDYVEGYSLQQLIDKNGILSTSKAIKYTIDILSALVEVHQNNILHRDIKPANLLIRNTDNEIIVIDFGIAREFVQDETLTQTAMISAGYAPPEQSIPSHKRTASMDLYSVGAVLYFCLTGKRPQTINELSIENYISAKEINPSIPKNLDDFITKAISKRPNERFQNAEEMIDGLKRLSQVKEVNKAEIQNVPKQDKSVKNIKNTVIDKETLEQKNTSSLVNKAINVVLFLTFVISIVFYIQSKMTSNDFKQARNYQYGKNGYTQNYEKALELYHELAISDHLASQVNLGYMYFHGYGTVQDYEKALTWFTKAAEQGSIEGQLNLGVMYEKGLGVEKNHQEAIKWYRKAAKQGNETARNNLKVLGESYP